MIVKNDVMDLLLCACPSYKDRWNEYYCSSYVNGEEQLLYLDLSDFARHLVELYAMNRTEEFSHIFSIIEQIHIEGDDYVKEAITIGLLEDLQNILESSGYSLEKFDVFLKPVSKKWWNAVIDFWAGKIKYVGEEQ